MERPWPEEAVDYEAAVAGALQRLGGVELARRSEAEPSLRDSELRGVLVELGLLDLDVHAGEAEAAAAARAMLAAGAVVCPWPLVQQLSVPTQLRGEVDLIYLRDGDVRRLEHLDLANAAIALDVSTGEARQLAATGRAYAPLDPFGVLCELRAAAHSDFSGAIATHVVLAAFWVLGALGRACELAAQYAEERRQFGRRIADFGAIQWHLSDLAVAHNGLWELACFSLARMIDDRLRPADVIALQFTTAGSAQSVMRHAHQVFGAIGLCEEHDLTILNRHLQPLARRPCGPSRLMGLLVEEISRSGFESLYPVKTTAAA